MGHTALKRFNDIVTITTVVVFLDMIAMNSLCVIAALVSQNKSYSKAFAFAIVKLYFALS